MAAVLLDPELLDAFAGHFFGYGNQNAHNWLVSMEERGGQNIHDINARLAAWDHLERPQFCDVAEFHRLAHIGVQHFIEHPALQKTWYRMIRIILASQGIEPNPEIARLYQRDHMGRELDETCLVPLRPLPAPSIKQWPYPEWTDLPQFQNRTLYEQHVMGQRIPAIVALLEAGAPNNLIFLGAGNHHHVEQIIQAHHAYHLPLQQHELGFWFTNLGHIQVVAGDHPNSWGRTHAYFDAVGHHLHETHQQ
jgi:hypothetical protein